MTPFVRSAGQWQSLLMLPLSFVLNVMMTGTVVQFYLILRGDARL